MRIPSLPRTFVAVFALLALALPASAQSLRIYVIDVEQGASTLLISPAGRTLLVDSGKDGHGGRIHQVMTAAGVTQIDHYVTTHYHEDHFGGIDELMSTHGVTVVNAYDRGEKDDLDEGKLSEQAYIEYQTAVGHRAVQLDRGETIPLDPAMTVTCIASSGMVIGEQNPTSGTDEDDRSVALLIEFGSFRYFVGGDIQVTTEGKIAARDLVLDVDLYQANHHGAETSSSLPFMQGLRPSVVVISSGNHGRYHHPRQHTLDLLASLVPAPEVFQTNKFLKGPPGGNVIDAHIADQQSTDTDGTILVTVAPSTNQLTVSYADETHSFAIRTRTPPGVGVGSTSKGIVIESMLPNPVGNDDQLEAVTIRNLGPASVSLAGWLLRDASGNSMDLADLGRIERMQSLTILRAGAPISLNNNGDTITLIGPGNQVCDHVTYEHSPEGVLVTTPYFDLAAPEDKLPVFPWGPPAASSSVPIQLQAKMERDKEALYRILCDTCAAEGSSANGSLHQHSPRLGHVDWILRRALDSAGYFEVSYFYVPDGFALVSRLEQIEADGTPKSPQSRWNTKERPGRNFDLQAYLRDLFIAPPGYYRLIVFITTSRVFDLSRPKPSRSVAEEWLRQGGNALPRNLAMMPYTPSYICTAVIYEFEKYDVHEDAISVVPGRLSAMTHLEKSKCVELLR